MRRAPALHTPNSQARDRLDEFVAHQKRDISNTQSSLDELEGRCNEVRLLLSGARVAVV